MSDVKPFLFRVLLAFDGEEKSLQKNCAGLVERTMTALLATKERRKELEAVSWESVTEWNDAPGQTPHLVFGTPESLGNMLRHMEGGRAGEETDALVLLPGDHWERSLQNLYESPALSVRGIFRASRIVPATPNTPDPEELALFQNALLDSLRRFLKPRLREEDLSKPITWKATATRRAKGGGEKGEGEGASLFSLFSDPAMRRLLSEIKQALRRIQEQKKTMTLLRLFRDVLPTNRVQTLFRTTDETENGQKQNAFPAEKFKNLVLDRAKQEKPNARDEKEALEAAKRTLEEGIPLRLPSLLLVGESGTGKTLLARWIARSLFGGDGEREFFRINMAAIGSDLADSELFGVVRGTFTDAQEHTPGVFLANPGKVLFLDEIGDMLPEHQSRLLLSMDEGRIRPSGYAGAPFLAPCVLVAATNRPVQEWAAAGDGRFRGDLLARFQAVVRIPPLRERRQDMKLLISLALQRGTINPEGRIAHLSLDALDYLLSLDYPDNFRGLEYRLAAGVRQARAEGNSCLCLRHLVR
jgi:transcriptional regulator with PAS, ATPase and Fis domain